MNLKQSKICMLFFQARIVLVSIYWSVDYSVIGELYYKFQNIVAIVPHTTKRLFSSVPAIVRCESICRQHVDYGGWPRMRATALCEISGYARWITYLYLLLIYRFLDFLFIFICFIFSIFFFYLQSVFNLKVQTILENNLSSFYVLFYFF